MRTAGLLKRATLLLMVAACVAFTAACGDDDGDSKASDDSKASKSQIYKELAAKAPVSEGPRGTEEVVSEVEITPEETTKLEQLNSEGSVKIGYSTHTMSEDFWKQVTDVFTKRVKEFLPDAKVVLTDGEIKPDKQLADIESLLTQQVDIGVIAPIDQDAVTPGLTEWNKSGTKLVIHQTKVADSIDYDGFCGSDNYLGGYLAGAYLADILEGKGDVASIRFPFKLWHADLRNTGFEDAAKAGGLTLAAKGQADANDAGDTTFQNLLTSHPDLTGGFGLWDGVGLGMAQAVTTLGRDDVSVVTHDLTSATARQIRDNGVIKATAVQLTDSIGESCANVVLKVLADTDMKDIAVIAPEVLATPKNVEKYHERLYGKTIDEAN